MPSFLTVKDFKNLTIMSLSHLIKLANFLLFPDFLKDLFFNQVCLNQVLNKVHILHLAIALLETLLSQTFLPSLPLTYAPPFFCNLFVGEFFLKNDPHCMFSWLLLHGVSCSFIPHISSKLVIGVWGEDWLY